MLQHQVYLRVGSEKALVRAPKGKTTRDVNPRIDTSEHWSAICNRGQVETEDTVPSPAWSSLSIVATNQTG